MRTPRDTARSAPERGASAPRRRTFTLTAPGHIEDSERPDAERDGDAERSDDPSEDVSGDPTHAQRAGGRDAGGDPDGGEATDGETTDADGTDADRHGAQLADDDGTASAGTSPLAAVPTELLRDELDRRERELRRLLAQRDKLRGKLRDVDRRVAELDDGVFLGGPSGRLRFGLPASPSESAPARPARIAGTDELPLDGLPLPKALARVMSIGETISPREAASRVRARGYRTSAKNFNTIVTTALSKDKRFRRVGRGRYERVA